MPGWCHEYSFTLYTRRLGERVRKTTNPFTGEPAESPIDLGMTAEERDAVRRVFHVYGIEGQEPDGEGYARYIAGNGSIRFRGNLEMADSSPWPTTSLGVEIVVMRLSDDVLVPVLDVARKGNLAFMSSWNEGVSLVEESDDPRIKRCWPGAGLIQSVEELRGWLESKVDSRAVPERML